MILPAEADPDPKPRSAPAITPIVLVHTGLRIPGYLYGPPSSTELQFHSEAAILALLDRVNLRLGDAWSTWWNWPGRSAVAEFSPEKLKVEFSIVLLIEKASEVTGEIDRLVEHLCANAFGVAPAQE